MFSILIPTWNNLDYLKLCIESIRKHSKFLHEIIVHVNEGSDGTVDWLRAKGVKYSYSSRNVGVPLSLNSLASMASHEWLAYVNDDMVCCPDWDVALTRVIRAESDDMVFLSSRLIEPTFTNNDLVVTDDFGRTPETFDERSLLTHYMRTRRAEKDGRASQPTVVSRRWWHLVGGYSVEMAPGMSTDIDFLMKLWTVGFRRFKLVDESRIYHFACRSTGRVQRNRGGITFAMKWGITEDEFKQLVQDHSTSASPDSRTVDRTFPRTSIATRVRRMMYSLRGDSPLKDIASWDTGAGLHLKRKESALPVMPGDSDK